MTFQIIKSHSKKKKTDQDYNQIGESGLTDVDEFDIRFLSSCEKNHKETKSNAVISIWDLGRKLFITKFKKKKKKKPRPRRDGRGCFSQGQWRPSLQQLCLREAMNDRVNLKSNNK